MPAKTLNVLDGVFLVQKIGKAMGKREWFKPFKELMADKLSTINGVAKGKGREYGFSEEELRLVATYNGVPAIIKKFFSEEEAYEYVCGLWDAIELFSS